MEYEVRRIPVGPAVKVMFFVFLVVGFIGGLVYGMFLMSIISTLGGMFMQEELTSEFANLGLTGIIVMGIMSALFSSVFMSLMTAFSILCYNVFAGWLGGVKLEMRSEELNEALEFESDDE